MKSALVVLSLALSLCLTVAAPAVFSQANATLSGTVTDATGARIPGVDVEALNNGTGVRSSTVTNAAGAYTILGLVPGVYTVTGALPGFETSTYTDVTLGTAATVRLDIDLVVQGAATAIEVSVAGDQALIDSSSSVGDVLESNEVAALPLVSNNVLDLVAVMAGVTMTNSPIFGANSTEFAGVTANNINIQRDGVSVNGQRWPTGVEGTTELNPDLVGEIRMILAPVDAEMGRGNAQIQVGTRSGTNEFHGALDWNVLNSAIDANTWGNNNDSAVECGNQRAVEIRPAGSTWCPTEPAWRNLHEGTASIGGPIVQNQTHFFALYNQKWSRTRTTQNVQVLTPCALNGIFRYYDNWNNGNALQVQSGGGNPTIAVVDPVGTPLAPAAAPTGVPAGGGYDNTLRYLSVFGTVTNTPTQPDCSDAIVTGGPRDPLRPAVDPTGIVQTQFLDLMPAVNNYDVGDGLNVAGHRWVRPLDGADNLFGIGEPNQRKQFNIKIDHVLSDAHKANVSYSYETTDASDSFMNWPDTYEGRSQTRPQVLTANLTSTLSARMVNELRFGMTRQGVNIWAPLDLPANDGLRELLGEAYNGMPLAPKLGGGVASIGGGPEGARVIGLQQSTQRDNSPRYQIGDTLSITSGEHSFKFGGEFRHASSKSFVGGDFFVNATSNFLIPVGGAAPTAAVTGFVTPNLIVANQNRAQGLLNFLAGSLSSIGQYRFINDPSSAGVAWNDPDEQFRVRDFHQNEIGMFFKDDWKILNNLTLNLGMRWDYYGPPYEKNGVAATLVGASEGLFGISGTGFEDWWSGSQNGSVSNLIFIGKNSPNPDIHTFQRDVNNFGPAVGFAWNLDPSTTVRGGYQLQYIGFGGMSNIDARFGQPPGSAANGFYTGESGNEYLDFTDLTVGGVPLPISPTNALGQDLLPMEPFPLTGRTATINVYDVNHVNPYTQNVTMSVTRNVARNFTLDVRYIGTFTRKNFTSFDVNQANFMENGLFEAFEAARNGGQSPLLDQMFMGIQMPNMPAGFTGPVGGGDGAINPGDVTGADVLRRSTAFVAGDQIQDHLALGDYDSLADALALWNYSKLFGANAGLPNIPSGVNGAILALATDINGNPIPGKVAFPDNFILTNPQFGSANLITNGAHSNYHSLQVQGTLRPTYGVNLTTSYTWSKNLGVGGNTYTDPRNREADYTFTGGSRDHVFRTYGTFNLPFGPGQLVGGNTTGFFARLIEGWQTSWIFNASTGPHDSFDAEPMLWGRGTPDQVREFDFNSISGLIWEDGELNGNFFDSEFTQVPDPQCANISPVIQSRCSLTALADSSGNVILQNPLPGTKGNMGENWIVGLPAWSLDMAMSKSFQITEGWRGTLRMDASNVLNHPTPDTTPNFNINSGQAFGTVASKGEATGQFPGWRQFQARLRLEF